MAFGHVVSGELSLALRTSGFHFIHSISEGNFLILSTFYFSVQ